MQLHLHDHPLAIARSWWNCNLCKHRTGWTRLSYCLYCCELNLQHTNNIPTNNWSCPWFEISPQLAREALRLMLLWRRLSWESRHHLHPPPPLPAETTAAMANLLNAAMQQDGNQAHANFEPTPIITAAAPTQPSGTHVTTEWGSFWNCRWEEL
jgi:hypothetical protein